MTGAKAISKAELKTTSNMRPRTDLPKREALSLTARTLFFLDKATSTISPSNRMLNAGQQASKTKICLTGIYRRPIVITRA